MADPRNERDRVELGAGDIREVRDDPAWTCLAAQYPGHPNLADEAIYSLPGRLLDAIVNNARGLLTTAEEQFERDLSTAASCGFFRQLRFHYPPLSPQSRAPMVTDELGRMVRSSANNIEDMLVDDMRSQGVTEESIFRHFELAVEKNREIEEWRWSYAGWVVTSSDFRRQRDELRSLQSPRTQRSDPPSLPITLMGQHTADGDNDEYGQLFLSRWGLESLATWDLPIPMKPKLATPTLYPLSDVSDAGLTLFIPWYLLRKKNFSLYDLAKTERLLHLPAPLGDWLDCKDDYWGADRWATMLRLYVYLELCLKRRYANRVIGKLTRLDNAFAEFFSGGDSVKKPIGDESIRKIRLNMQRRLGGK